MSTLVHQIMAELTEAMACGHIAPGARLPSIRQLARERQVSTFTVADAYERLMAMGKIRSEQGKGYFAIPMADTGTLPRTVADAPPSIRQFDEAWLLHGIYQHNETMLLAGCGWLPESWYDPSLMQAGLRQLARQAQHLGQYGNPLGFLPLRELIAQRWQQEQLHYAPQQILLTHGASQALDLITTTFTQAGDTVLVDAPAYSNLLTNLRSRRLHIIGIPWTATGPDTTVLAHTLQQHRPKLFFTNPILHNPTGASYNAATAHQVLSLAQQHGFLVVENQVSMGLSFHAHSSLAAMDNHANTLFVHSFTKTLSPSLRVGCLAAANHHIEHLTQQKMLAGLTTSPINEQLAWHMLQDPKSQKQLNQIKHKLAAAQQHTGQLLKQHGWTVFTQPHSGLFIYACHPAIADAYPFAQAQYQQHVSLAPGVLYQPNPSPAPNPWFRFNVAYCDSAAFQAWLTQWRV